MTNMQKDTYRDLFGKVVLPMIKFNIVDINKAVLISDDVRFEKDGFFKSLFLENISSFILVILVYIIIFLIKITIYMLGCRKR